MTSFAHSAASAASGEAQPYLPLRSLRSLGLRALCSHSQSLRSIGLCASRSRFSVALLPQPSHFALATYPMSLPGSQGVSMPSFMPIGPKLWVLEGYIHTDTQTVLLLLNLYRQALRVTLCLFRLALWDYSVALLPRASRSHLVCFDGRHFALCVHENFLKKSGSQSTRNALKPIEMQKKNCYPFDQIRASRLAQCASGKLQPYLPHVTSRVPRSVHAKFPKLWALVGLTHTVTQTHRQTVLLLLYIDDT